MSQPKQIKKTEEEDANKTNITIEKTFFFSRFQFSSSSFLILPPSLSNQSPPPYLASFVNTSCFASLSAASLSFTTYCALSAMSLAYCFCACSISGDAAFCAVDASAEALERRADAILFCFFGFGGVGAAKQRCLKSDTKQQQ